MNMDTCLQPVDPSDCITVRSRGYRGILCSAFADPLYIFPTERGWLVVPFTNRKGLKVARAIFFTKEMQRVTIPALTACTQLFLRSKAGCYSREYYDGSVPLLLAQGGVSRILTYSTSLSHFRCPFASFNGITSHRFPKRAFHWYSAPQCISHPCRTDVYFGNVAISVQRRAFLTAKGQVRFGNSASP